MQFKRRLICVVFICALVIFGQTPAEWNPVMCEPVEATGNVSYQSLQPDEFMTRWLVLGAIPISNDKPRPDEETQKKAFANDFLVDHGGESGIHPAPGLTHKIGDVDYAWQFVRSEDDIIDLTEFCGKKEFVIAYAWAEIEAPEATTAVLGIGSDDGVKVWLNGELVHENWIGRPVSKDNDAVGVTLREGKNQLLLKVQNGVMDWGFACRVISQDSLFDTLSQKVAMGDLDAIEMLLSHGVDVNAKDKIGLAALHVAKIYGRAGVVDFLLENGADASIEMPSKTELMDAVFKETAQGDSPGIAVLVAKDGEIVYQKGFGFANLKDGISVTPDTKFRIGSVTKQFTAAAILKLQEDDLLNVDDHLSKFIPDYPRGDEVTIHHLLTHTSGIHSYTSKPDFKEIVTKEIKPQELIESFKNDDFDFDPGEKWLYNNSGYFLLSYIVEKISGESYGDYLKKHFFDPLGMENTGVYRSGLNLENEAMGYSYENGKIQRALDWDMSWAGGAGALYSTVGDLFRWNEGIFNGEVLSESSLKAAFTPVTLNDGSVANGMGHKYGYGWAMPEIRGLREIQHGGGLNGFNSALLRYPDQNVTVVILANCLPTPPTKNGSVGLAAASGARAASYCYLWEQMDTLESFAVDTAINKDIYDGYIGRYDYGMGGIADITRDGDRLFVQLPGQPKLEIFPRSETEFFWKVVDAQITFVRNEDGAVTHAIHYQNGAEIEVPKLKDETAADVDSAAYDAYVGQYDYGRGAILTVTKAGDRLFAQMAGQPKLEIFPRSKTEFFWKAANAQVTFVKNDEGKVIKVIHHQGGMEIEAPKIK